MLKLILTLLCIILLSGCCHLRKDMESDIAEIQRQYNAGVIDKDEYRWRYETRMSRYYADRSAYLQQVSQIQVQTPEPYGPQNNYGHKVVSPKRYQGTITDTRTGRTYEYEGTQTR